MIAIPLPRQKTEQERRREQEQERNEQEQRQQQQRQRQQEHHYGVVYNDTTARPNQVFQITHENKRNLKNTLRHQQKKK